MRPLVQSRRLKGGGSSAPASALRSFFLGLVRPSFADLGCGRTEQVTYVTDLLTRFARTDQLYRIRNADGRRLETVADMLLELMREWDSDRPYRYDREVEVRRHCGDYALFMCGLFRDHVEGHSLLSYYLLEGPQAYRTVAERMQMTHSEEAAVFWGLADQFEQLSGALDYMRKVYMRPVAADNTHAEVLRQLDLN